MVIRMTFSALQAQLDNLHPQLYRAYRRHDHQALSRIGDGIDAGLCADLTRLIVDLPLAITPFEPSYWRRVRQELIAHYRLHGRDDWDAAWRLANNLAQRYRDTQLDPTMLRGAVSEAAVYLAGRYLQPAVTLVSVDLEQTRHFGIDWQYQLDDTTVIIQVRSPDHGHLAGYWTIAAAADHAVPLSSQPSTVARTLSTLRRQAANYRSWKRPRVAGLLLVAPPSAFDPFTGAPTPNLISRMNDWLRSSPLSK